MSGATSRRNAGTNTNIPPQGAPELGTTTAVRDTLVRVAQARARVIPRPYSDTDSHVIRPATTETIQQPNIYPSVSPPPAPREQPLQMWEGRVISIGKKDFVAYLVDLSGKETEESEELTLPISEVSDADQALLEPNAVFGMVIGFRYNGATKERFSRIVFRRLPAWTASELKNAHETARELMSKIVWE